MNLSDTEIKRYLQLTEPTTESPDLEAVIMRRIEAHQVQQQAREHSFRIIVLLAIISMLCLLLLFFYSDVLLASFSAILSLNLSNYTLIIAAFMVGIFLFISIDPILKSLFRRRVQHG